MALQTLIIVIAILIFAVIFLLPVLANLEDIGKDGLLCGAFGICLGTVATEDTEKFKEEVDKQEEEADLRLPDETGGTLCDLSVFVDADMVDEFGFLKIEINGNDPADYQWHCQFPSPGNWLASLQFDTLTENAFFFESEFIHAEIVLIDMNNRAFKYDANHEDYKSMFREIRITDTSGFIDTPLNMDQTFYVQDVVHGDYILEIYYGRNINDLDAGDPLLDKVCKVSGFEEFSLSELRIATGVRASTGSVEAVDLSCG